MNIDGDNMAYSVTPATFTTTFRFEWTKAPLSLNYRMHRMAEAKITKELRTMMYVKARHIPNMERVEVALIWFVNTKTRRDNENPIPTLKALCDGLVDADVVDDDTPEFMVKLMPEIRYLHKSVDVAHFEFRVTEMVT